MMNGKTLGAELRRDAFFVRRAAVAVVFIGFAGVVVVASVIDFMPG